MRRIIPTALSAILLTTLAPLPAQAAAANTAGPNTIEVFWTTLVARGAAVDVNYGVTCPADFTGTATVSITQTRDDGLTAAGATVDEVACSGGGVLHITRVTASVLGAPFERGRARLTMLVTGSDPINQNTRLQN